MIENSQTVTDFQHFCSNIQTGFQIDNSTKQESSELWECLITVSECTQKILYITDMQIHQLFFLRWCPNHYRMLMSIPAQKMLFIYIENVACEKSLHHTLMFLNTYNFFNTLGKWWRQLTMLWYRHVLS